MKKEIIISILSFGASFAAFAAELVQGDVGFFGCTFGIGAVVLSGYLILALGRQKRIMDFLIEEKRKEKHRVIWSREEEKQLELIKKRIDLYTLQGQINPHFLYNTLDSIRSKAMLDGQEEIASMTKILSRFFRYCIGNEESLVQIREEINHIGDYYLIQKFRFEERFHMEICTESEEIYNYFIPRMTLQPLVENAMIHGLEKVSRKGILKIKLAATEKKIMITVSDNGAGMDIFQLDELNERMNRGLITGSKKEGHNSIAVSNVNARIKMTFGEEFGIYYRSMANEGTDAVVMIPRIDSFMRVKYEEMQ